MRAQVYFHVFKRICITMNKRQEYNLKILQKLFALIMEEPDLRFIQALWALRLIDRENDSLNIKDRFYEEPEETLKRIEKFEERVLK